MEEVKNNGKKWCVYMHTNKICQSESDHEWECTGMSTAGTNYICRKCYARKTVPYVEQQYISITGQN